jgi:hypothetical protein
LAFAADEFSSEDDADRRHSTSIRSTMKRIVREAKTQRPPSADPVASLGLVFRRLSVQEQASPPPVALCVASLARLTLSGSQAAPRAPLDTSSAAPCPPPSSGFACPLCGHVFSLRKTRDRHRNACAAAGSL